MMATKSDDSLGDRMKFYEQSFGGGRMLMPTLPAIARLDGKAFHTFTIGLDRPFDERLSNLMRRTMVYLVEESNARIGYTQSDEITLIWKADRFDSEIYFGGKIDKLVSVLASQASVFFNRLVTAYLPGKADCMPVFDCRVWNVPSCEEAVNTLIWREQDATRNSISMAAQSAYSHKQLHEKSCAEMQEMLFAKGINWNDYPKFFKRGTYARRKTVERPFTTDEIDKLPAKHEARSNPALVVARQQVQEENFPILTKIINRVGVCFHGEEPRVEDAQ